MARYRHATSGALVSVRDDKVLGSEWERLEAGADDAPAEPSAGVVVGEATVTIVPSNSPPADAGTEPGPDEPPRSGKGSGRDAWVDHAVSLGIEVTDEATRDEIIELVDAHAAITAAEA